MVEKKFITTTDIAKEYGYTVRRARAIAKQRGITPDSKTARGENLWLIEKMAAFRPMPRGRPPTSPRRR
jgi:hypothetical protein|tara:strand:+ start:2595 stop:2801 length:207 start_codon:yes stop_codon:yes gene_type:complete